MAARPREELEAARAALRPLRRDPALFVRQVLGAEPDPWQLDALREVATRDRVAIRSGHGVGKSVLLAWVVLWFVTTRFPCKVPVTGSNFDQLRATLWAELRTWLGRMPARLQQEWDISTEALKLRERPDESFVVLRTAAKDRAQNLAGFHSDNVLVIVDEASAVDDLIFDVLRGALTDARAKLVLTGNPTQRSGTFYRAFHDQRALYVTRHVSCLDSQRVSRAWVAEQASLYGADSNVFRVRVLGEFPLQDQDGIIPIELIESAVGREVAAIDVAPVWGVDVAGPGGDRTALAKRQGNVLLAPVQWWSKLDTEQVAGRIHREYLDTAEALRPARINIDSIGIGAGVYARLRRQLTPRGHAFPVASVNVAESPAAGDRYERLRDELWWRARDWFAARDCSIPNDEALIGELAGPRYEERPSGRIKVESKDAMRARGVRSPDLADAFVYTFAGVETMARDRSAGAWRQPVLVGSYDELHA